ncbi:MAG: NAD(P)-dependent oxidoreductase [Sutterellaceae bacterium]|nr:NAD(P)-dependent oxidoreductase [Sutterellaceae bacterium]
MLLDRFKARIAAAYQDNEYPVGRYQAQLWAQTQPLKGLRVLDATPIFQNTLSKYISLLEAGAELLIGLSDVMPKDPEVVDWLKMQGARVVTPKDDFGEVDLILDCAGAFSHLTPKIGYVELTRSGVYQYANAAKPVFIADGGRIKRIETCLGTGESYFRALTQLGYQNWHGKSVVIFGSGKVGTGLITYAHKYGCRVTVVTRPQDLTATVRAIAHTVIDAADSPAIRQAVLAADFVVTATGVADALAQTCPAEVFMQSKAVVANMGVEDEFGAALPAERVLENKRPVNFILKDPTLMKYIDATMALHNAGAVWLVEHPQAQGLIDPPAELEAHLLDVCRRDGTIGDELQYI